MPAGFMEGVSPAMFSGLSHALTIGMIEERVMPENKCPNAKSNEASCPCTADDCPRHGVCCECIRAHVSSGNLPACARELGEK